MKEPTKADLAAAVAKLTEENAALRDLLAAVRAYADMPHPADYTDASRMYEIALERRVDAIAVWANGDREDMAPDVYVPVFRARAKHLREEAARPVAYEVRAEPEPARVGVPESMPIPQSHYCDSGNCDVCGDGTGDAAGVPAAAITAGTPAAATP